MSHMFIGVLLYNIYFSVHESITRVLVLMTADMIFPIMHNHDPIAAEFRVTWQPLENALQN